MRNILAIIILSKIAYINFVCVFGQEKNTEFKDYHDIICYDKHPEINCNENDYQKRIKNIKESVKNAAKDMHSNLLKDTVESGDVVSGH